MLLCDKEDGCSYGIWIDRDGYSRSQSKAFEEFSEQKGLVEGDESFYRPQVAPYLDRAQLGKVAKNNFEDAKKFVKETVQFMQGSNIRDAMLGMRNK